MATMTLNKRLDLIQDKILEKNFITGRGTANEVNFWIFDYDAEDEMAVRSHVGHLVDKINKRNDNVRIAHFDLYDLMLDVLRSKNYLDKVKKMEESKGSDSIINPVKRTLRLTEDGDIIIQRIIENLEPEKDIIFLTGVGKAFPLKVINPTLSLQNSDVEKIPVIVTSITSDVEKFVTQNIDISRNDWDSFETSWDFKRHPLIDDEEGEEA